MPGEGSSLPLRRGRGNTEVSLPRGNGGDGRSPEGVLQRVTPTWYPADMHRRDRRLLGYARTMRRDPTPAEQLLWWRLRGNELGFHFRRQEPIGPFIADFACRKARLIVESVGDTHEDPRKDAHRHRYFAEAGWRVVRFDDPEVKQDLEGALDHIWRELHGDEE